ncbi:hypothetical protein BV25DRAFT_359356 [Artomyces pyxidatus]|uniref:Uncharacterized protein n=1 Tax=Artomyces pyxidatus TaxID=48021 RepID=A0ACB8T6M5_9AGAM|nr:hypothetical protein BV25DRAFT_359356 [Artomyces pyxidatus]
MLVLRRDIIPATPITMLPNELIGRIFSFAATRGTKWIKVTHVCKQWRNIALGNTTLWNSINLLTLKKSWAVECLRRSSPGPFSTAVTRHMPEAIRDSLEAGDILRLLIVHDESIFPIQDDDATTLANLLFHRTTAAPILKSLQVWRTFPRHDRLKFPLSLLFPSEIRNLRSLSPRHCALDWDPTYLANLVYLHVIDPDVTTPGHSLPSVAVTPTEQQLSRSRWSLSPRTKSVSRPSAIYVPPKRVCVPRPQAALLCATRDPYVDWTALTMVRLARKRTITAAWPRPKRTTRAGSSTKKRGGGDTEINAHNARRKGRGPRGVDKARAR